MLKTDIENIINKNTGSPADNAHAVIELLVLFEKNNNLNTDKQRVDEMIKAGFTESQSKYLLDKIFD